MKSLRNAITDLETLSSCEDISELLSEIDRIKDKCLNICDDLESKANDVESVISDINKSSYIDIDDVEQDIKDISASLY